MALVMTLFFSVFSLPYVAMASGVLGLILLLVSALFLSLRSCCLV